MGILAALDLGLKIIERLQLGTEAGLRFYQAVKAKHPNDVPDKTDAEVIEMMKGGFQSNIDDINSTLDALGDN